MRILWLLLVLMLAGCGPHKPPAPEFTPGETTMEPRVPMRIADGSQQVFPAGQPLEVWTDYNGEGHLVLARLRRGGTQRENVLRQAITGAQKIVVTPPDQERPIENYQLELWRAGDPLPLGFVAFSLSVDEATSASPSPK